MHAIIKYRNLILLFVLMGFVVYFPSLFNGFAYDDYPFILQNPGSQLNIQALLGPNLFNSGTFYRPIPAIYFAGLYSLFGQTAFFYHFIQIVLHIISTVLVFFFFLRFFPSRVLSSFLALVFLVHPINVESVAFISSTTSEIYFLFGMSAFLIGTERHLSSTRIGAVFVLSLLAILTKETGVLFLVLLLFYRHFYMLGKLRVLVMTSACSGIIYLLLRVFVGGVTVSADNPFIPIKNLSLIERLVNIPAIVLHYLETFVLPWDLSVWQVWIKTASFQDFVSPLIICLAIFIPLVGSIRYLYQHNDHHVAQKEGMLHALIFFTCWYAFTMAPLLQIIPLDMTVADRWFYFPIVGVLGIIGVGLQPLLESYQRHKVIYIAAAFILISLFTVRTYVRVLDWKDNVTLFQHDISTQPENSVLMVQLALALYENKRTDEALMYANKAVSLSPDTSTLSYLGFIYKGTKQYDKAIAAYTRAIEVSEPLSYDSFLRDPEEETQLVNLSDKFTRDAYIHLAETYRLASRSAEAIPIIEKGLMRFRSAAASSQLYYYIALLYNDTGNSHQALAAIKKSYELTPNKYNGYIYYRLSNGLSLQD